MCLKSESHLMMTGWHPVETAAPLPGAAVMGSQKAPKIMEKGIKTMKKEYSVDYFRINEYLEKPITEEFYRYENGFSPNTSSILTRLIQEAGRYCEHYASDLFIDWITIDEFISSNPEAGDNRTFLFGFRRFGVDHAGFVLSRFDNEQQYAEGEYRSMWRMDITVDSDEMRIVLGRVF